LLTLYTTPVIYLWFDRLAARLARFRIGEVQSEEEKRAIAAMNEKGLAEVGR
jgi:hypothetical protein